MPFEIKRRSHARSVSSGLRRKMQMPCLLCCVHRSYPTVARRGWCFCNSVVLVLILIQLLNVRLNAWRHQLVVIV